MFIATLTPDKVTASAHGRGGEKRGGEKCFTDDLSGGCLQLDHITADTNRVEHVHERDRPVGSLESG